MASADKLWFELGVRDEVSGVLETLMKNSENLANALSDETAELKNIFKNIVDISNVYDKIYVAQKRISELKGNSLTKDEKKGLKDMSKELEDYRKQFAAIFKNPDRLTERGEVQFDKMRLNFDLLLKDVLRYVDHIEAKDAAEAKNAANESQRIENLKSKYYELQRYRKQLSDAIAGAASGADLTDATSLINAISGRMGNVARAQRTGAGLPSSVTGADYDEFLRKVKAELNSLTGATNEYNNKLEQNRQIQASLNRLKADAVSQQTIAGIRKQSSEYTALGRKIQEITTLIANVQVEQAGLASGRIASPTFTRDRVTEELSAIQRRYNEALATGRQRELDDAAAKNQKTAATRKAMEAVSALAHVNQGLISSYNRVAEAGSQANRITVQFQNQIGAYAGLYGLERLLKSIVTIGGQFEVQHVALKNILGDVQEANILFGQLKELAIESPKTFMELTSYAKQLSAYQIPANELFDTTKRLADMSSGLGVDMNRLILAYGQVRSAAVLRGQELRQFTEAGIPMVQALADKFTQLNGKLTTTADVFKLISARAVPFEMVKEVLWDMTSQGGQFFNMQEELANTLYGKWQKLQDSWQIMLGSIAEGTNASGFMFKFLLDIVVALTQNLDKMVFTLSALGAAKGLKALISGLNNAVMHRTGEMAIENMKLAKLKEASRLDRERIWNGRQLSAEEQKLVANKNKLVSSDYQILALENQITAKKAHQLMLDGQMSKQHFYRYLQMQGYTREQRKQIALGNLQAFKQGPNPTPTGAMGKIFGIGAKGVLGFFGGWVGVAITAVGVLTTVYELISQSDERLNDLVNSISGGAERNANQLATTLRNVENSTDEPYKKVETLEEALLGMGAAGKQVVQESRGFDEMGKRLENLTENAQAYQEALDAMGSPEGKSAIKEALDNSGLNDEMEDYEDLQNAEFKRVAALERYSAKYQQMIDAMKAKHKELNDELTSNNLYENLRKLMTGSYAQEAGGYFAGSTPYGSALLDYAKAVEKSEAHLNNIKNNVIPNMMGDLKVLARRARVDVGKNFDQLTEAEKTKLRALVTEVANGLEKGSQEAKNSVASWLAQGLYTQLYLTPVLNVNELTGLSLALDQWQQGKGYNLWNKNDLKEANNDFVAFSKKQSQRKVDLEKRIKNYNTQLKGGGIDPGLVPAIKDQRKSLQEELDELNKSLNEGQWVFDKSLTKGNKGGGSKTDQQLKQWKEQLKELENFYKVYKRNAQYMSNDDAIQKALDSGVFSDPKKLPKNIDDYLTVLKDFRKKVEAEMGKKPSTERKSFLTDLLTKIDEKEFEVKTKEAAKAIIDQLEKALKEQGKRWDLYKKILDATGNKEQAGQIAFGRGVSFDNYAQELRAELEQALAGNDKVKGKSIDELMGMSDDALRKLNIFAENTDGIYKKLQLLREEEQKVKSEEVELFVDALKNAKSLDTELSQITLKYQKARDAIRKQYTDKSGVLSAEGQVLINNTDENENRDKANKQWEYFKKTTEGWGEIFSNLDRASDSAISSMIANLEKALPKIQASEEATKALYEALDKLRAQQRERNPFGALYDSIVQGSRLRQLASNGNAFVSGKFTPNATQAKYYGLQEGKNYTRDDIKGLARGKGQDLPKAITAIGSKFQALQKVLSPVIDLFDALGEEDISDIFKIGNDMFGSAASVAEGFNSLKNLFGEDSGIGKALGAAGPWAAAAGAALSMVSGIFALHDKALQEEIDASKARQKEMENLSKNLETALERTLGSIYETRASDKDLKKLAEYQENFVKANTTSGNFVIDLVNHGNYSYISEDAKSAIDEALKSQSYYDTQFAMLQLQRDELQKQMDAEGEKKDSDAEAIADYKQQIAEMDDQIKHFAEDMAKAIYDIDIKSWATELGDALFEAWQKGEDGAEAFKNKAREIITDVAKKIVAAKLIETAMQPVLNAVVSEMERTDGKLNEKSIENIATAMEQVGNILPSAYNTMMDGIDKGLQKAGLGSMKDDADTSSTTASKVIQGGFTENETGLLLSYINAMRADLSFQRQDVYGIRQFLEGNFSEMPIIAQAQLQQLQQIARNTLRNADAADSIYELLHRLAPDGTKIKVG